MVGQLLSACSSSYCLRRFLNPPQKNQAAALLVGVKAGSIPIGTKQMPLLRQVSMLPLLLGRKLSVFSP
jgi:hypothetical protein